MRISGARWGAGWARGRGGGQGGWPPRLTNGGGAAQPGRCHSAAAGVNATVFVDVFRFGSALILGGGAVGAGLYSMQRARENQELQSQPRELQAIPWVQKLASQEGMKPVLSPGQMLRCNLVANAVLDQDHLFGVMMEAGQIQELTCYYNESKREFHSIVSLGKDVCGFPQTVHGGLTATICDETLGGLAVCMWQNGALGFRPPAYTARLELDYKKRVPAGSVVLCSTQVESLNERKLWMKAEMSDGQGTVYANARALFVAPSKTRMLLGFLPLGWVPGIAKPESKKADR